MEKNGKARQSKAKQGRQACMYVVVQTTVDVHASLVRCGEGARGQKGEFRLTPNYASYCHKRGILSNFKAIKNSGVEDIPQTRRMHACAAIIKCLTSSVATRAQRLSLAL
jgi:hypothetical protein